MVVSYKPKANKNVIMISTLGETPKLHEDNRNKPEVRTRGGISFHHKNWRFHSDFEHVLRENFKPNISAVLGCIRNN